MKGIRQIDMKLAIVGTHSVGKSTLADQIEKVFNIPQIRSDRARELSRSIIQDKRLDELSNNEQVRLQNLMKECLFECQESNGPYILDCCSITCGPYARNLIDRYFLEENKEWFTKLSKETLDHAFEHLDYVLYIPLEITLIDDGFRPTDLTLRESIDTDIRRIIKNHPKTRIITGTMEDRLLQVQTILGERRPNILSNLYTFEGLPKAGKTTLINTLKERNPEVVVCERLGTPVHVKEKIKDLYKDPYKNAEELMYHHVNSFKDHIRLNNVMDQLADGKTVIMDRSRWTAVSLQLEIGDNTVFKCLEHTVNIPVGNVIFVDTPPNITCGREMNPQDNAIKADPEFQEKIREAYISLLPYIPTCNIISGLQRPDALYRQVSRLMFPERNLEQLTGVAVDKQNRYMLTGTPEWGAMDIMCDLQYQLGTIGANLLRMRNKAYSEDSPDHLKAKIGEDLADIIYEALLMSDRLDIDIVEAWKDKQLFDLTKLKIRKDNDDTSRTI